MTFQTKSIIGCILAGLLVLTPGYSAPFTEEYISKNIANEDGDGAMIKEIKAMPMKEREKTIRSALKLVEKLYKERNSRIIHPKLNSLVSILPSLGLPDEVAAQLAPMIDCEDPEIRLTAFKALTELDRDVGLDIVASRMKYLVARFPSVDIIDAHLSDKELRQIGADTVAATYGLKSLLLAQSSEKRKLGLNYFKHLEQKYAHTEIGRKIYSQLVDALEQIGVTPDLIKDNAPKTKRKASEALSM